MSKIWYPYAQMKNLDVQYKILKAKGTCLYLDNGEKLIDAISSWWCVIHGYNHPEITRSAKQQLDKMAHVMLGGLTHNPACSLAAKLVEITPYKLKHVFFADSGSVGVEVALKMAVQYWHNMNQPQKHKFLAFKKAYHGDTCGVMSISDPDDGMHTLFKDIIAENYFLDAPEHGYTAKEKYLVTDLEKLDDFLRNHHYELAAFIVEPLMQAAGGFNFYSAEYLKEAGKLCDKYNVLLIFDEVATGFGRTGTLFAADQTKTSPDIMILGKGLSAGYTGISATLASTEIFESFYGPDESNAFMHGPTFMGNPLACAIALKSIEIFERDQYLAKISKIESVLKKELFKISSAKIKNIRVLGATGVIEVKEKSSLAGIQEFAVKNGIWLRPFGNYVYTMPPYIIEAKELKMITETLSKFFKRL